MTRDQTKGEFSHITGAPSRRRFIQSSIAAGLAAPTLPALFSRSAWSADEVKRGGTLTIATTAPTAVDPHQLQDPGGRAFVQPVVNYLVRVTADLQVVPELATAWESSDAKIWTVKLRQGVKFHNGKAFTAADVVWTFDLHADPANKGKFMRTGLWARSRHPNYFCEIVLWVGVAVIALPVLQGWTWVALISPVFVTLLLTRVSGVPLLEKKADKKWGGQADYEAYKKSTPVLIPKL